MRIFHYSCEVDFYKIQALAYLISPSKLIKNEIELEAKKRENEWATSELELD